MFKTDDELHKYLLCWIIGQSEVAESPMVYLNHRETKEGIFLSVVPLGQNAIAESMTALITWDEIREDLSAFA